MTPTYRYRNGVIEVRYDGDSWTWSAHDRAGADEVARYEAEEHPAAAALRAKFAT